MDFTRLKDNWEKFGVQDPLWAILSDNKKRNNKWEPHEFFERGKTDVSLIIKKQRELGINIEMGSALDFGCGLGRLTQALCEYYKNVIGVDIAESMIEQAKKYNKYGDSCIYLVNPKTDLLLFQDKKFDAIYTFIVLQHMESKYSERYIKEFMRILNPGGLLVFQLPSRSIAEKTVIKTLKKIVVSIYWTILHKPVMELHVIEKQDVIKLIEQNNGKIMKIEQDNWVGPDYLSYTYWVMRNF